MSVEYKNVTFQEFVDNILQLSVIHECHMRPIEILPKEYRELLCKDDSIVVEFGVGSGYSLRILADSTSPNIVHGFDSFYGLPEDWQNDYRKGAFSTGGRHPEISNAKFHVGLFDDTLPDFKKEIGDANITFLHIDCDLYSSTKTIFDNLENNIRDTIVIFDELFMYETFKDHEIKAFWEFLSCNDNLQVTMLCAHGQNAAFIIKEIKTEIKTL